MLFKKFKDKITYFFEIMMIVLHKLEFDKNELIQHLTNNNNIINNSFNESDFNILYMEEFY